MKGTINSLAAGQAFVGIHFCPTDKCGRLQAITETPIVQNIYSCPYPECGYQGTFDTSEFWDAEAKRVGVQKECTRCKKVTVLKLGADSVVRAEKAS